MQSIPTSKRMPLVIRDTYQIDLEYNEEFAILHLPRVDKFTKQLYKDIESVSISIREFLFTMGYNTIYAGVFENHKAIKKLLGRFNFEYIGTADGFDVLATRSL